MHILCSYWWDNFIVFWEKKALYSIDSSSMSGSCSDSSASIFAHPLCVTHRSRFMEDIYKQHIQRFLPLWSLSPVGREQKVGTKQINYGMLEDENYFKKKKVEQGKRNVCFGMEEGCSFKLGGQSRPPLFLVSCCCCCYYSVVMI